MTPAGGTGRVMEPALEGVGAHGATVPGSLTHEDLVRSNDRLRVHNARNNHRRWYLLWLLVGPGILAMLGENDRPSMVYTFIAQLGH
jgi:hypothetical protein